MSRLGLVLLAACLAAAVMMACGDDSDATSSAESDTDAGSGLVSSSSETAGEGGQGSSAASSGSEGGSDPSGTVSRENPGFAGTAFDVSRNMALAGAEPLDVVTWTMEPTVSSGSLEAQGTLEGGAAIFNPMVDGEGAGFMVYHKNVPEPMVVLLPDLGPMDVWETTHTVAPMEHEFEGPSFTFRAYSPLFMDVGPGDLEIRVYGTDGSGADALLAVADLVTPSGREGGQDSAPPAPSGGEVAGQGASSASSESPDSGQGSSAASPGSGDASGVVSRENPGLPGTGLDDSRNAALEGAEPLDVVTWTMEPTISFGALEAEGDAGAAAPPSSTPWWTARAPASWSTSRATRSPCWRCCRTWGRC